MKQFTKNEKKIYEDFFEMAFQKFNGSVHPLSKEELDSYANTFTKYLNANMTEMQRKINLVKNKKFKLSKYFGFKYLLSVISYIIFGAGLIAFSIFSYNTLINSGVKGLIFSLSILVGSLILMITTTLMVNNIKNIFIQYKNMRDLSIDDIYIYDINGLTFPAHYNNPFSTNKDHLIKIDDNGNKHNLDNAPIYVQITGIDNKYIYIMDLENLEQYKLNIKESFLLSNIRKLGEVANVNTVIRYPRSLPMFSNKDIKVIEAAAIVAHLNNEAVYHELTKLMAKIRFYTEYPYSGAYTEEIDNILTHASLYDDLLEKFDAARKSFGERLANQDSADYMFGECDDNDDEDEEDF